MSAAVNNGLVVLAGKMLAGEGEATRLAVARLALDGVGVAARRSLARELGGGAAVRDTDAEGRKVWSYPMAAKLLGVGRRAVANYVKDGKLKAVYPDPDKRSIGVTVESVEAMLAGVAL